MTPAPQLTISELARMSGVTVRALHHYDHIGLLRPTQRTAAGYRLYDDHDVERLARVVALRAMGLSLADVAVVLDSNDANRATVLRRQLEVIDDRMKTMQRQREFLLRSLEAREMTMNLDPDEIRAVFGAHDPGQFEEEAADRWGETDAYAESRRRTSEYTKDEWIAAKADADAVVAEFMRCQSAGLSPDSVEAMAAADLHRDSISRWYYHCTTEMHVGLAEMYVADPRFASYYDDRQAGLSQYVHDAIVANALLD
jgi:DNA-binding transcriptional MerR regulator